MISDTNVGRGRSKWLGIVGAALFIVGVARLLLDLTATAFGSSISCGNAVTWLDGAGPANANRTLTAVCGAQLHNASLEGVAAIVAGLVLLLAWAGSSGGWPLLTLAVLVIVGVGAAASFAFAMIGLLVGAGLLIAYGVLRGRRRLRLRRTGGSTP